MNIQIFLDNFGHISDSPGGVKCLREMVYQLGISGSLCRQNKEEGDGAILLEKIEKEKRRRIADKSFKRSPRLESLEGTFLESLPDIPDSWSWTRLVDIGEINPRNDSGDDALCSFASMSSISEMHAVRPLSEIQPWKTIKKGYTHFADGDAVVAKITPCFENGKAAVMNGLSNGIGAGTTELHVIRPLSGVYPHFIYIFLRSPYFRKVGAGHMTGTAGQKRLPTEYFATRPFPLPPTAEQKRIVAKVDELMALCDKLERQQQERQRLFPVLSRASHARFTESPSLDNLKTIFDEAGSVSLDDTRKTILSLAIRGKLVPQDQNDESADELLEKITSLKSKLSSSKKSRRLKSVVTGIGTKVAFEIPPSWLWVTFGEIMINRDGERVPVSKEERERKEKIYDYYGASGVIDKIDNYLFDKPLLLIGEDGANLINRSTPIAFIARGKYWVNNHAHVLDGITEDFLRYIEIHINAINLEPYVTGTAQPKMNQAKMNSIPIALPPLAEQARIVAKVDQLMALVDQLEQQQNKKNNIAGLFAQAAVMPITGTQIKEQEKMKAPKTELVTKLQVERKPRPSEKSPLANLIAQHQGEITAKALWKQSGMEIDAFYQQLKTEMANGWIVEQEKGFMKEVEA